MKCYSGRSAIDLHARSMYICVINQGERLRCARTDRTDEFRRVKNEGGRFQHLKGLGFPQQILSRFGFGPLRILLAAEAQQQRLVFRRFRQPFAVNPETVVVVVPAAFDPVELAVNFDGHRKFTAGIQAGFRYGSQPGPVYFFTIPARHLYIDYPGSFI